MKIEFIKLEENEIFKRIKEKIGKAKKENNKGKGKEVTKYADKQEKTNIKEDNKKSEGKSTKKNNKKQQKETIDNIDTNKKMSIKEVMKNFKRTPRVAYLLLSLMIIVCVCSLNMSISKYKEINKEDYISYNYDDTVTVSSNEDNVDVEPTLTTEASSTSTDVPNIIQETVATISENTVDEKAETKIEKKQEYEYKYEKPLDGKTIKEYSMDKVVYSKTLDMWKVHDGIDLLADIGTEVKSSEKGIVERVYNDNFYGWSVIIDHQNGIKTVYRNLDENILVKEKDSVKKGQTIAKIGNSASGELKDESHLHFEVIKNGEIVNPNVIGIE